MSIMKVLALFFIFINKNILGFWFFWVLKVKSIAILIFKVIFACQKLTESFFSLINIKLTYFHSFQIKTYFWERIFASFAASDSFHDFFEASHNALKWPVCSFSFSNSAVKPNLLRFENLIVWMIMLRCIKMVDSSFFILSSYWLSMTYNGAKLFNILY